MSSVRFAALFGTFSSLNVKCLDAKRASVDRMALAAKVR